MDIVVVPLWQRAGFTEACLTRLAKAMDDQVKVRFCLDFGFSKDVEKAARQFASKFPGTEIIAREVDYPTGTFNVLSGMAEALNVSSTDDRGTVVCRPAVSLTIRPSPSVRSVPCWTRPSVNATE